MVPREPCWWGRRSQSSPPYKVQNWQFHSEFEPIDISGKLVCFEFELNYDNNLYSYIRINISGKLVHFEFELKYNIMIYRIIIELIFQERWRRVHLHRWEQSWSSSWSSASRRCFLWELRASYLLRKHHDLNLFLRPLKLRADVHWRVSELD